MPALGAILVGIRFAGVVAGIAFLSWALNQLPVSSILQTALGSWPLTLLAVSNYFGVTAALQCFFSFIILRVIIAAVFAVARMF